MYYPKVKKVGFWISELIRPAIKPLFLVLDFRFSEAFPGRNARVAWVKGQPKNPGYPSTWQDHPHVSHEKKKKTGLGGWLTIIPIYN